MDRIAKSLNLSPLSIDHLRRMEMDHLQLMATSKRTGRFQVGEANPNYGVKASDEKKRLMKEGQIAARAEGRGIRTNYNHSDATKAKMRAAKLGKPSPRKGKTPWNKGMKNGLLPR